MKYLELCHIPLRNYFWSSWFLFPNLKTLILYSTCYTLAFLEVKGSELSLSLEVLILNSINDVKDEKKLGVILLNLESVMQLILINMKINCHYLNSFNPKIKIERRKSYKLLDKYMQIIVDSYLFQLYIDSVCFKVHPKEINCQNKSCSPGVISEFFFLGIGKKRFLIYIYICHLELFRNSSLLPLSALLLKLFCHSEHVACFFIKEK